MAERVTDPSSGSIVQTLPPYKLHEIGPIPWGPVRSVLEENFSFGTIKAVVATAGLDMGRVAHLDQISMGGATKGQLMTALDGSYKEMADDDKGRFVTILIEEILRKKSEIAERLEELLSRLGWSIISGRLLPIHLFDRSEIQELPQEAQEDLGKAARRLRDGDLSGTISAACGAVDNLTGKIYREKSLGDPGTASFQEKVSRCLEASNVFIVIESDLVSLGWETSKATQLAHNLRGSLNQAANVMQALRSQMGDVHGTKPVLKSLVFDSIQWAKLIVALLQR